MTYRAGIIGCGFIGVRAPDSHLKAYRACPEIELVGLADAHPIPNLYENVPFFLDYKQMIWETKPDIVSICTPLGTHCQIVCDIASFVKAIYCEKPIALTLEGADKMIEVCHKNNIILQINHQRRFMPVKVRFSRDIIDTGTHMFDRLRQLFGEFEGSVENIFLFGNQQVEIEYVKSDEHIFEIDCVRSTKPMILKGVEHLVDCLDKGHQSISSGEEARRTLEALLFYERNR